MTRKVYSATKALSRGILCDAAVDLKPVSFRCRLFYKVVMCKATHTSFLSCSKVDLTLTLFVAMGGPNWCSYVSQ